MDLHRLVNVVCERPLMYSYDDIHCELMGPRGLCTPCLLAKLKSIKTQTRTITKSMTSNLGTSVMLQGNEIHNT